MTGVQTCALPILRVTLGDKSFDAVDWGLGGCRLQGLSDPLPQEGTPHKLLCTLPFQGFNITLEARAEVVRCFPDTGEAAFQFVDLGERETALMRHFVEDLVRGKMTDVADTIVRIDTPVTPVPTKPDPNPVEEIPLRRWPVKQIAMSLFYLCLGVLVFGYVGIYVFATLFRLETSTAVVSADRVEIRAPAAGRLTALNVQIGQIVTSGAVLARFENRDLQTEIRKAETALMQAEVELAEHELYFQAEAAREQSYKLVAYNDLRQAQAQTSMLEFAVKAAEDRLARYQTLHEKGHLTKDLLSSAELELRTAESALENNRIDIAELERLGSSTRTAGILTGNRISGIKSERSAEVSRWQKEVSYRQNVLERLREQPLDVLIKAPFDGVITSLAANQYEVLKTGAPVLVLQETGNQSITAFLTQDEVGELRIGTSAKIYIPTEDRWVEARVASVNRTDGFVDEITQMHRFRAADSRSARAELISANQDLPGAGTPVTVYFERYRANQVIRFVSSLFEGAK